LKLPPSFERYMIRGPWTVISGNKSSAVFVDLMNQCLKRDAGPGRVLRLRDVRSAAAKTGHPWYVTAAYLDPSKGALASNKPKITPDLAGELCP
jgi:hypothetical protein